LEGNIMEKENNIHKVNIVWPQPENGIVAVDTSVDFIYIMRKDGDFTINPIAEKFSEEYFLNPHDTKQVLLQEYDTFVEKLADILQSSFSHKGSVELHIYDPDTLDQQIREKATGLPVISLDPLMTEGVHTHGVSRGYYLSGQHDFGQVARPGMASLLEQAKNIANELDGKSAVVAEDDIFSGGSVIASLEGLIQEGTNVHHIIPGIQVGIPAKLTEMGITVDPVIKYKTTDDTDIFDKVDLGDPRDYLVGASGLVVKLPNGEYGRAPYLLPFVTATARAGIPKAIEKTFSFHVLQANYQLYNAVEEKIGKPVLLKQMHPDFVTLMHNLHNFDHNTPMKQVVAWAMNTIDTTWQTHQELGSFQEHIKKLQLPQNIVFIDVNGTLIPDDSVDGRIAPKAILQLKEHIKKLQEKDIFVGLCSDSPLLQLEQLAVSLGINGPIIAENGNLIAYKDQQLILQQVEAIDQVKQEIQTLASTEGGFVQQDDTVSKEFGGTLPTQKNHWSFGANRVTSISVFGSPELIQKLGDHMDTTAYGIDCSPQYSYFALHPGNNFRLNKSKTLSLLAAFGKSIVMVGDSMSDWVDPENNVTCAFVNGSRITPEVANKSYVSKKPTIEGILDILEHIQ